MNYAELSKKVQEHLLSFYHEREDGSFAYHNLLHTQSVVKSALQIANHYQLDEKERFIVFTAAWFHDAGYIDDYNNHEERGAAMAAEWLGVNGAPEDVAMAVSGCILATRMPQSAVTRLEMIVCDADLFHLGTDEFSAKNKLMRQEVELKKNLRFTKDEWRRAAIKLLEAHHYYTDYCQVLLNDKKRENLEKLKKKAAARNEKTIDAIVNAEAAPLAEAVAPAAPIIPEPAPVITPVVTPETILPALESTNRKKKEDKDKNGRPDRGIETMFRITSNNNQRLSDMADNKAQIMITVNSIILSAVISILLRKLEEYQYLAWPTYLILTISVLTIIFSILATRPNLPPGQFSQQDINEKKVNLLFFGNFYKMNLSDYTNGMLQVMNDRDYLYGTLIKDIYSQGVVLGRKYKLLRISYNIFMFGLIASVLAFVAASILGK